ERFTTGLRLLCEALLEEIALLGCLAEIGIVHLGERLWSIVDFRRLAAPGTQHGPVVWKGADIHRRGAGARPTKALHTTGHIGLEAHAGLFTVVANVDPHFE